MGKLSALFALLATEAVAGVWQTDAAGKSLPCWQVNVLADVATGWPGACLGLTQQDNQSDYTTASCAAICKADALCSIWQLTGGSNCWVGLPGSRGSECMGRSGDTEFRPTGAQRLQQGNVQVLKNYTTEWVSGLKNIGVMSAMNGVEDRERCKHQCYSAIDCRYWMYGKDGCWVDDPATNPLPAVPVIDNTSEYAKTMVAGEHIQNVCPPPPKPEESFWTWPVILGLIALLLLILAAIFFLCCQKEKKVKKTRAVKVAPKKEEPAPAYTVLQPAYTTYVQPTPTYQMVPSAEFIQAPMIVEQQPLLQQSSVMMAPPMMQAGSVMAPPMMQGGSVMMERPMAQGGSIMMGPA